ncbi:hypothetical protein LTR17_016180 [Elasticomyces elasticus]|nr:hypothetical protein LTR17_016180 [Elasticomyces elasticus]
MAYLCLVRPWLPFSRLLWSPALAAERYLFEPVVQGHKTTAPAQETEIGSQQTDIPDIAGIPAQRAMRGLADYWVLHMESLVQSVVAAGIQTHSGHNLALVPQQMNDLEAGIVDHRMVLGEHSDSGGGSDSYGSGRISEICWGGVRMA